MNRARPRNHSAAFRDITADIVLVITAVAGQRNRNHKVIPIISDEIQYNDIFFVLGFSKSPAKLLDEHDRRLCRTKHDDLIDLRHVHTLGKYVYGNDVVQGIFEFFSCQPFDRYCSRFFRITTAQHQRPPALSIEFLRQFLRLINPATENQPLHAVATVSEIFRLFHDIFHTFFGCQITEVLHFFFG